MRHTGSSCVKESRGWMVRLQPPAPDSPASQESTMSKKRITKITGPAKRRLPSSATATTPEDIASPPSPTPPVVASNFDAHEAVVFLMDAEKAHAEYARQRRLVADMRRYARERAAPGREQWPPAENLDADVAELDRLRQIVVAMDTARSALWDWLARELPHIRERAVLRLSGTPRLEVAEHEAVLWPVWKQKLDLLEDAIAADVAKGKAHHTKTPAKDGDALVLKATEMRILKHLARCGSVEQTIPALAEDLELSDSHIRTAIKRMCDLGVVKRAFGPKSGVTIMPLGKEMAEDI